jgi:hypothetical protein
MLFVILLLTGCQPDTQAVSTEVLASPEFQAAVDAAVAQRLLANEVTPQLKGDVVALQEMAKCLSDVKGTRHWRVTPDSSAVRNCGRLGLVEHQ